MRRVGSAEKRRHRSRRATGRVRLAVALAGKQELFEEQTSKERGIVADDAVLFEEIVGNDASAELEKFVAIEPNGFGIFRAIAAGDVGGNGFGVGDDHIDDLAADVLLDGANVIAECVMSGFGRLGHQVGDVHARGFRTHDGVGNFRNQQIGNNTGVKGTRAHEDKVSEFDGFNGGGERTDAARIERELSNGKSAPRDARFAVNAGTVGKRGDKVNVRNCGRKDAAANGENFGGDANGFGEISGDMREGREEQVAEIVTAETASGVEAVLKESCQQRFVLGKGDQAIADIAGREHAVLAAQTAGAATVIGDGDNGGKIGDRALGGGLLIAAADDVLFKTAKESGEPGAAAESNHADAADVILAGAGSFHEQLRRFITNGRRRAHLVRLQGLEPQADSAILVGAEAPTS